MGGFSSVVRVIASLAAAICLVYLLMYYVSASTGNPLVHWFEQAANWLATWSRHLFDQVHNRFGRATLVYGIPALVYLLIAGALGRRRLAD